MPDSLKIKIAIDTQILAYLIDNTYPRLTCFFKALSANPFVDIVCSRFSTYEFVGIRKLEHYLRKIHLSSNQNGQVVNFSSLLKYKNDWNAPELNYSIVYEDISLSVNEDMRRLNDDFNIKLEVIDLHNEIWNLHRELVLSSKISKEDALVLISTVFPQEFIKEKYLIFFTNDDKFFRAFCGDQKIEAIDNIFSNYGVNLPQAYKIIKIKTPSSEKFLNLITGNESDEDIRSFALSFIKEHLLIKNADSYLGKVVSCPQNMIGKLLCFKLEANMLNDNLYLTILDKYLNSFYNIENKTHSFFNIRKIDNYPYIPDETDPTSRNISVELKDAEGDYLDKEIYDKICSNGNLIFIHPDTYI